MDTKVQIGNIIRIRKEYIIDETAIKAGSKLIWLWIVIEPANKQILSFHISKERNMFVTERFLSDVVEKYGEHSVSTDGGTWYPQACRFLKLNHHLHSSMRKVLLKGLFSILKIG